MLLSLRKLSLNLGKALHASKIVKTKTQASVFFSTSQLNLNKDTFNSMCPGLDTLPVKEISIPVPYGKLAAKAWGQEKGHPMLALHGWMDNCGTFDRLIPLLDRSLYIVALDLPGHGLSSHLPKGCFYTYADMIQAIEHVKTFLGWKEIHMIGHSMGAELAQLYSGFFPELVEKIILLDTIKPISLPPKEVPLRFAKAICSNIETEKKLERSPPVYSEERALEHLLERMHHEISSESGKILLIRGSRLSDCGTGVVYTRDLRLRNIEDYYIMSDLTIQAFMSRIRSEMLMIRANKIHPAFVMPPSELDSILIDMFTKNCKRFALESVDGNHFVHLNEPQLVAPLINTFITD